MSKKYTNYSKYRYVPRTFLAGPIGLYYQSSGFHKKMYADRACKQLELWIERSRQNVISCYQPGVNQQK